MFEAFDRVTCPIYSATPRGFDHEGTVALFRSRKSTWVITASHVVTGNPEKRYWIGGSPLQPLDTEKVFFCPPPADVAFFELPEAKAQAVRRSGARFLTLPSFGTFETECSECVVTGYPHRSDCSPSVAIDHDAKQISVQQMVFESTLLSSQKLEFIPKIERRINVAVRADRMREVNTKKGVPLKGFDFRRLSGGLVWQRQKDDITRAVAIVTDHDPKQKLLIGTILEPLLFKIAEKFGPEF